MIGEAFAGLSAFKSMYDAAKALKDINDATIRNGAVIELQEKILAARDAQETLLKRIGDLEKEVTRFEAWKTEKDRYQLTDVGSGTFAYALKAAMRGTEPPHYICANCYEQSKKSILHHMRMAGGSDLLSCPRCSTKVLILHEYVPPSYSGETSQDGARAALNDPNK
jgi:DNA-directed RNA polymerase subunit RPC12/RpoP